MSAIRNIFFAAAAALTVPAVATAQGNEAIIVNQSSFTLYSLYISPSASNDWGPDQLADEVVPPGGNFSIHGIPCGTYDVMLTNPAQETCTVPSVNICSGAEPWVLTDADLIACGG